MRKTLGMLLLTAALVGGGPAVAQAEPTADQLALSKRLIVALGLERQLGAMYDQLMPVLVEQQVRTLPNFKPEWRAPFSEAAVEASKAMAPRLVDRFAVIYAKTFTPEELRAAVSFYESPIGRSVTTKSEAMMQQAAPLVRELGPVLGREILERFCDKTPEACSSQRPATRRS